MWIYLAIFVAKMVEVSLATVRNVLINRGEKVKGAVIGFFECLIWVIVVSNVLDTVAQDPVKVVFYCLAFAAGNYLGVIIEGKLAIGTACIQAVVEADKQEELSSQLRKSGFGVTRMEGQGKDGPVDVLMIFLKRRFIDEASDEIRRVCPGALITVNDVRQMRNGFLRK